MEYNYPKFTPEMKKTHTILIPNMAITQFRLLEYALRYDGYRFPAKRPAWQEIFRHFWRQDISWKKPAALINFVRLFTLRRLLFCPN